MEPILARQNSGILLDKTVKVSPITMINQIEDAELETLLLSPRLLKTHMKVNNS